MIGPDLKAFLEEGLAVHLGTRNDQLQPSGVRATAVRVDDEGRELVVFVPSVAAPHVLPDLQANGQAAVVFVRPHDDRSCQVKGEFVEAHEATTDDQTLVMTQWNGFLDDLERIGIPRTMLGHWITWPAVAIRLRATALFNQTPGPAAGARIA